MKTVPKLGLGLGLSVENVHDIFLHVLPSLLILSGTAHGKDRLEKGVKSFFFFFALDGHLYGSPLANARYVAFIQMLAFVGHVCRFFRITVGTALPLRSRRV